MRMVKGASPILARTASAVAAIAVAVCVVAAGAGATRRGVVVSSARNSELGEIQILVSANGHTLYRSSLRTCSGACSMKWLPLVVPSSSKLRAGAGVSLAQLGRIKRSDGRWQVTYHGSPLYLFSGDTRAGQVNGQGIGGVWHVLTPGGVTVTKAVVMKASGSASSSGGSQSSSSPPPSTGSGTGSSTGVGSPSSAGMWCAANPASCVNGVPTTTVPTTPTSG